MVSMASNVFVTFQRRMMYKYDFLSEGKHQSLLQAGSIIFTGHSYVCPKYPE